jgi:hypothetical protein
LTSQHAKRVLLLYRPHAVDAEDPEMAQALALTRQDAELRSWFEEHCGFQKTVHQKLCHLPVPAALKEQILQRRKVVHVSWWRQPAWLAAAAAVLILAVLTPFLLQPERQDKFDDYRSRMVRSALRQYRMDIETNNLEQVRQFLSSRGAPADYRVPPSLAQMTVSGGGQLKWRGNPVSMVCFDKGGGHMLFLFVMNRDAVKASPGLSNPELKQVSKLGTASWTEGNHTYILAGEEQPEQLRTYLPRT